MALALGDILQITDGQSFLGQVLLNVYFYEVMTLESLTDYDDVQGAFKLQVVNNVKEIQSSSCLRTRVTVKNLTNGVDIAEYPYTDPGNIAGEALQSFTALSMRLVRSTALTRHGSKRIGGLPEAACEGNSLSGTGTTLVASVVNALESTITVDGSVEHDFTARPVIIGRFPITDLSAGELDLSMVNPVASAQFIRLTSQATRRAGRGI